MINKLIQKKKNILGWILLRRMEWDSYWYCRKKDPQKLRRVFGIGLSRTGTTSFHEAMQSLGWNSAHSVHWLGLDTDDLIRWTRKSDFNCFSDTPYNENIYARLYSEFPDALFVLTTRDKESWKKSIERWLWDVPEKKNYLLSLRPKYEKGVVNTIPENQLLVLDLGEDNKMEKLCSFLGVEYNGKNFPYKNVNKGLFPRQRTQLKSLFLALFGVPIIYILKRMGI